jgi:hypothetical protein
MVAVGSIVSDYIGLSPDQLQYLFEGYLSQLGAQTLALSDIAVRSMQGKPSEPTKRPEDIPFLGPMFLNAFVRSTPAKYTVYTTDLYDLYDRVNRHYNDWNTLKDMGEIERQMAAVIAKDNKLDLILSRSLKPAIDSLGDMRKQYKAMMASPRTSEAKRLFENKYWKEQSRISKQALEAAKRIRERYEARQ